MSFLYFRSYRFTDISGDGEDSTLDETDCFAVPSRIRRSKKANKENSTSG